MRTIYAIQLRPQVTDAQSAMDAFIDLVSKTCSWVERKYDRVWKTEFSVTQDGSAVNPLVGHTVKANNRNVGHGEIFELDWFHPDDHDDSLTWATTGLIARNGNELQFALLIRITTTRIVLRPVRYDLGRPRIVSEILESYPSTAKCHHIPITFVPPHPDQSGITWTENHIPLWRPS